MKRRIFLQSAGVAALPFAGCSAVSGGAKAAGTRRMPSRSGKGRDRVLIYTRNGKGYIHATFLRSVKAITRSATIWASVGMQPTIDGLRGTIA